MAQPRKIKGVSPLRKCEGSFATRRINVPCVWHPEGSHVVELLYGGPVIRWNCLPDSPDTLLRSERVRTVLAGESFPPHSTCMHVSSASLFRDTVSLNKKGTYAKPTERAATLDARERLIFDRMLATYAKSQHLLSDGFSIHNDCLLYMDYDGTIRFVFDGNSWRDTTNGVGIDHAKRDGIERALQRHKARMTVLWKYYFQYVVNDSDDWEGFNMKRSPREQLRRWYRKRRLRGAPV